MQANGREASGGSIRHKLGSLFSPRGPPPAARGREEAGQSTFITADVLRELAAEQGVPTQRRVRAMKELSEIVASKRLEEYAVQAIWKAVRDLLQPQQPSDVRQAVLRFTRSLVAGQYSELGVMRAHFFKVIQTHRMEEDAQQRLDLLLALTQGGKDIQYFEEAIGSFLVEWMPEVTTHGSAEGFLGLLVKLVHYNSAYLEEDVLTYLVSHTCSHANQTTNPTETELCLAFLDAVICYSAFPPSTVHPCVITLCHTLNIERFIQQSLEVMQRLLGTHLGRTVIYTMCSVLQDKFHAGNVLLLRGAVFYISMSLWGVKRVESLGLPFTAVLPAVHQASQSGHTIVVYEVALSVLRLVRHYAASLEDREWEVVFRILHSTQCHLTQAQQTLQGSSPAGQLQATLQDIFSSVELYWEGGQNAIGPADLFFQLLDDIRDTLQVQSALSLVHYTSLVIDLVDQDWIQKLSDFMDKFYRCERRGEVRKAALAYLEKVLGDHWLTQEEPLLQKILLPYFMPLPLETDSDLRCQAVQLLVSLLPSSSTGHTLSMLALLSQVLKRGLQEGEGSDPRLSDCKAAVFGLTQLLKEALYRPGPLAEQVFSVLVAFLQQLYAGNCFTATSCVLRINIFNCLLRLRADKLGQLGFYDDEIPELKYSPFYVCTVDGGKRSMEFSCTVLHLKGVFDAVQACLYRDVEWEAVFQLLHLLKEALQCRTLILSAMPDLSLLIPPLCSLAECHSARLDLFNTAPNPAEVAPSVYPLLADLATYPGHLDRRAQHDLVCCLEAGLLRKEPGICISALTVCCLELQATMTRFLPRVLYRLGQVAATSSMATPTLEFLAGLIPMSALVSGFLEDEYLCVFGIALPYTNPDRHSSYVVAMAHHVISMWFLRCRMRCRPRIARFISKGLSAYVVAGAGKEGAGVERVQLCRDLIETTLDMLARYTYSNVSSLPSRSSGAEFLVSGGPSKTWVLSNYLVTVTTTGEAGGEPGRCAQCMAELRSSSGTRSHASSMTDDTSLYNIATATGRSLLCSCWCWGWAEVKVRRPSGNTAWMLRLENRLQKEHTLGRREGELAAVAAAYNYPFETEEADQLQEKVVGEPGGPLVGGHVEGEPRGPLVGGHVAEEPVGPLVGGHMEGEPVGPLVGRHVEEEPGGPLVVEEEPGGPLVGGHMEREPGGQLVEGYVGEVHSEEQKSGENKLWHQTPLPVAKECESPASLSQPPVSCALPVEEFGLAPVTEPCAIERMPPLLSYETIEPAGRSPSLHGSHLTEQEQLQLVARAGRTSEGFVRSDDEQTFDGDEQKDDGYRQRGRRGEDSLRRENGLACLKREYGEEDLWREGSEEGVREGDSSADLRREDGGAQERCHPPFVRQSLSLPVEPLSQPGCSPVLQQPRQNIPLLHDLSPGMTRRRIAFQKAPTSGGGPSEDPELPNDPSFVFLQLFHNAALSVPPAPEHTPLLLAADEATTRAVKLLDHIPPYNTHKIGVVYVGKEQTSEAAILANTSGSSRFQEFLSGLGQLLRLADCLPDMVYLGGLDLAGSDGEYTYFYQDDTTQVVFHVATLMPTLTSDPQCSNKKLHIGNDFVTIVYNESGLPYQFGTIKGQFCYAEVVVDPLPAAVNRVCVRVRPGMEGMLSLQPCLCSSLQLPILARTKALTANFASLVHVSESPSLAEHHPSNWLDRLRQIRRIRARCTADIPPSTLTDFTTYS